MVPETAPFNPSTPYAVSKAACDMSLMTFFKAYKFPVVFTRAANVCGPGQQLFRIIPKTVFCIMTGEKLKLEGGGHSVRSFIHMEDVVDGTLKAARDGTPPGVYHLATDKNQTIRETVTEVCRQMNVPFENAYRSQKAVSVRIRLTCSIAPRPAKSSTGRRKSASKKSSARPSNG